MKHSILFVCHGNICRSPMAEFVMKHLVKGAGLKIYFTDIRSGFVDTALLNGVLRYPMMLRPENVTREIVYAVNHHQHIRVIDWKYRILTAVWRRFHRWI